jgi:tRNA(fMet)-specific endonuclease VapC
MYFLDANICIFLINAKFPRLNAFFLTHTPLDIKIPSVVLFELLYGIEKITKTATKPPKTPGVAFWDRSGFGIIIDSL